MRRLAVERLRDYFRPMRRVPQLLLNRRAPLVMPPNSLCCSPLWFTPGLAPGSGCATIRGLWPQRPKSRRVRRDCPEETGFKLILTRSVTEAVNSGDGVTITALGVKGNKLRIERYETLAEAKDAALKI